MLKWFDFFFKCLEIFDGVFVRFALLNGVQRQLALKVSVDPDMDVFASLVVDANLHEEVHSGDHLQR
jgi:hypothetical protein